jgi:thiosulfate/3-mercaptopyruvate sulfurtransferase
MSSLVAPEDLVDHPDDVTFLDVRWQLGRDDGRAQFEAGHVPGAAFVDLEHDLADPPHTGTGGRHPLPDPERFGQAMRAAGVRADRPVVVYDAVGGTSAARAWWLLRHHGHDDVRVLDGGWPAWVAAGGPVETGPVDPAPGDFEPAAGQMPVLDAEGAAAAAAGGVLVDARAPERFRGETEPVDPVAGHVPGAVNVPTAVTLEDGRLRDVTALREAFADALRTRGTVAAYCGSGVTAAHTVLALDRVGVSAALYAGSWSDWVSDRHRPVATGP